MIYPNKNCIERNFKEIAKMKIICMIPCRLGSQRVKFKNIRFLGDRSLVEHIIGTVKKVFDYNDIYLNASENIFKKIAKKSGIKFYERPGKLSKSSATNDDFLYDFLKEHECDWVIQAHSTSPFIKESDIQKFIDVIKSDDNLYDSLFAVEDVQMEGIYSGKPINYDDTIQMIPSQDLIPIQVFCNGLMAFKRDDFIKNYEEKGFAMFAGNKAYIPLKGYSTLDIDNEEDFLLAEGIFEAKRNYTKPKYFDEDEIYTYDVPQILEDDGLIFFSEELLDITNIEDIIKNAPSDKSWSKRIVNSKSNCMTLIQQLPNEGNRKHYHRNWEEIWIIYSGEWQVQYNSEKYKNVTKGDVVYIPRNILHHIEVIGDNPGLRIAISRADILHIYKKHNKV